MVTRKVPGTSRTALCFCTLQGSRRDGSSYARVAPRRCLRAGGTQRGIILLAGVSEDDELVSAKRERESSSLGFVVD